MSVEVEMDVSLPDYTLEQARKKELHILEDLIVDQQLNDKYRALLNKTERFSQQYVGNMLSSDERIELAQVLYSIMMQENGELSLGLEDRELVKRVKELMERGILSDWFNQQEGQSPELVRMENTRYRDLLKYVIASVRIAGIDKRYNEHKKTYIVFAIIYVIFLILIVWYILSSGSTVAKIFSGLGLFIMSGFVFIYQPYTMGRLFDGELELKNRLLDEMKNHVSWWKS